jgi:putative nucleic acid binding protein
MKKKYIWLTLIVIVLVGAAYGIREYTRGNEDLSGATADVSTTATDLVTDFSHDEKAANARYLNKVLRVTGRVKDIKKDSLGSYSIELESGSELSVVSCLLDKRHNDDATKIERGDNIAITGICTGVLMDVVLVRCAIE